MKEATIYEYARMCASFEKCNQCVLCKYCADQRNMFSNDIDKANEIILKWCEEHPVKTRQDKFLEMFPNAKIDSGGVIDIAPCTMEKGRYDMTNVSCTAPDKYTTCAQCRKEYWLAEVDENE